MLILVTGGARSGKSRHAEALIADSPQVLYLATSQIVDGAPSNAGTISMRSLRRVTIRKKPCCWSV